MKIVIEDTKEVLIGQCNTNGSGPQILKNFSSFAHLTALRIQGGARKNFKRGQKDLLTRLTLDLLWVERGCLANWTSNLLHLKS